MRLSQPQRQSVPVLSFPTYSVDRYLTDKQSKLAKQPASFDRDRLGSIHRSSRQEEIKGTRGRVPGAAAWTAVEDDACLHSRGMSAKQVSYADLGTGLYAYVLIKYIRNKSDCVEKDSCAGDQNKAYYHLIPEIRTSAELKKRPRPLPSAAFYLDILPPTLGKGK